MTRNEILCLIEDLKTICSHSNGIYFQGRYETIIKEERSKVLYTLMTAAHCISRLLLLFDMTESELDKYRNCREDLFNAGKQAALEKIAATLAKKDPGICLLYAMEWEDEGCCMDCVECVKNHFMKKRGAE